MRASPIRLGAWMLCLVMMPGVMAAADDVAGEIRFEPAREGAVWVGQELELNLELWSTAFSFGDQLFVLPEVRGGFLMQADSSTIKLSETRENIQWQGLRYTLLFYPQRAGRLEVPSFEVQFTARAGFGSKPVFFRHQTPAIAIETRLPPGAASSELLVTTGSFTMEASWTPAVPLDGDLELTVGDSLSLEIVRQAQDVPGMVFAPLPDFSIDGLAAYPDPPRVNDRINRGSLTGSRTDRIIFICERAGSFTLGALKFQWWDPDQEVLSERVVPALDLVVAENPAYRTEAGGSEKMGSLPDWKLLLAAMASLLALIYLARRVWPNLDPALLSAMTARLYAFSRKMFRRWIKAPVRLPPLNPLPVKKER